MPVSGVCLGPNGRLAAECCVTPMKGRPARLSQGRASSAKVGSHGRLGTVRFESGEGAFCPRVCSQGCLAAKICVTPIKRRAYCSGP